MELKRTTIYPPDSFARDKKAHTRDEHKMKSKNFSFPLSPVLCSKDNYSE